jgi:cytochrome c biogenesis protein CcdA
LAKTRFSEKSVKIRFFFRVLVFVLAKKMQNIRAGIAAGMICALHPTLLNCSSQILTEDWTIIFMLAALIALSNNSWHQRFAAGVIMGVACTVRSPCLALIAAIAIWWIIAMGRKGLLLSVPFCAGALLPILFISFFLSYSQNRLIFLTPQQDEMSINAAVLGGWVELKPDQKEERKSYFLFALRQPKTFLKERFDSFITFVSPWPFGDDRSLGRKLMLAISDGLVLVFGSSRILVVDARGCPPK